MKKRHKGYFKKPTNLFEDREWVTLHSKYFCAKFRIRQYLSAKYRTKTLDWGN